MLSRHYRFTVILQPERDPEFAGYFNATVPALPGCVSYGATKEEALRNIREAMEAYLADMEAEGEEVPQETIERVAVEV
jgi:predicted RNase H-like HicB family nuclease